MNCQECLEELSTTSLREVPSDSAVMQHCATCPDCARLTTRLREREYEAATILNNLLPLSSPISVAETSATLARRRRVGRVVVMLSGIGGALIIALVSSTMVVPAMFRAGVLSDAPHPGRLVTEIIPLKCLSPDQAGDIIGPYLRSRGSIFYRPTSDISAITVRATAEEVAHSLALIQDFEDDPSAACRKPGWMDGRTAGELDKARSTDAKPEVAGPDVAPAPTGPANPRNPRPRRDGRRD